MASSECRLLSALKATVTQLRTSFVNHDFPNKGISKLCLVNELDASLLLVASCNGNIRT
ncbi:hypothetical protein AB3S75_006755 [Citrus x aurantiifolia]